MEIPSEIDTPDSGPLNFESEIIDSSHRWLLSSKKDMMELGCFGAEKLYTWQGNFSETFNQQSDYLSRGVTVGFRAAKTTLPSLVVQSVWEGSHDQEEVSKEFSKWITLGKGAVRTAVLLSWNLVGQSHADCKVEILSYDDQSDELYAPLLETSFTTRDLEKDLPSIKVTVGQLFGNAVPIELYSGTPYCISLELLRRTAADFLREDVEEYRQEVTLLEEMAEARRKKEAEEANRLRAEEKDEGGHEEGHEEEVGRDGDRGRFTRFCNIALRPLRRLRQWRPLRKLRAPKA